MSEEELDNEAKKSYQKIKELNNKSIPESKKGYDDYLKEAKEYAKMSQSDVEEFIKGIDKTIPQNSKIYLILFSLGLAFYVIGLVLFSMYFRFFLKIFFVISQLMSY